MPEYQIIDADGHVLDNRDKIMTYISEPMSKREWTWVSRNTWDSTLMGQLGMSDISAQQWLTAMDQGNVELTVLYPTRFLNIGFVQERDVAVALCRAYNDYLYEEFLRVSPRFKGVAMVPLQDIGEAVLELRRAVTELGMVAAMLPTHGPMVRPLLGDSSYFPLYEEAQRLGCPLALHANVTNPSGIDVEAFEKFIESHTVIHPFGQMRQLTSLIFEGVLERFPTLTFASMEAGATWVPFFVDRMDEEFAKRGAVEAPLLKHPPSHYFRTGRVYVHFEPGEGLLPQTLDYIGEDYFVYATDYPHWDSEFPASVRQVQDRQDLSETAKVKILRDNALRLYHLD